MDTVRLKVRFVPNWLSALISYYGQDPKDFQRIVSKYDVKMYRCANAVMEAWFRTRHVTTALQFEDAEADDTNQASLMAAALGPDTTAKFITDFKLERFAIYYDKNDGVLVVADDTKPPRCLMTELLKEYALYKGEKAAYASDLFRAVMSSE